MVRKRGRRRRRNQRNTNECDFDFDDLSGLETIEVQGIWELKFISELYRVWISSRGRFIKVQQYNQFRGRWGLGVVTEDA